MYRTKTVNWVLPGISAGIFLLRWSNMVDREPNIDTSTWLAGVISIDKSSDPIRTWLNYSDGRPLTVAPLLLARALGFEATYPVAEGVGIICWLMTLLVLYKTFRWLSLSAIHSLSLLVPIMCWLGTTGYHDHIAYNSEAISVLMLTVGVSAYVFAFHRRESPDVAVNLPFYFWLCLGIWLGALIYAKFQNAPMGLVIAAFLTYQLLLHKQWSNWFWLVLGGILPTVLINLYFAWYGELATFWNDYFWYYFYYGYSDEYSKLSALQRFNPWRAGSLMWQSNAIRFVFAGLCVAVFVSVAGLIRSGTVKRTNGLLLFACCYLFVTFYAVLQSGNPFTHYTLFLPIPLTFLIGAVLSRSRPSTGNKESFKNWVYGIVLITGIGQGVFNLIEREPLLALWHDDYDRQVVKIIKAHTQPNDRLVIWGYADRFYIYTGLAMGYRWPYTIGIYSPSALHEVRVKEFLKDMLQNKPAIFIDLNGSFINNEGKAEHQHEYFPPIANFVGQHYQLIAQVKDGSPKGVRIYKRK